MGPEGQPEPQVTEPEAVAPVLDDAAPPADPAGEPAPEVTLESLHAEITAANAAIAEREARLEEANRQSAAKDRALQRTRDDRDRIVSEMAGAKTQAERDAWGTKLRQASEDPEAADALIRELRDQHEKPAAPDPTYVAAEARKEWGMQTHALHRAKLGITEAEEQAALSMALQWASDDGREQCSLPEIMAAESEVAMRRVTGPLSEKAKALEEENEALKAGDAGTRMRAAGGPEERVPSNGGGKTYKSREELDAARASREISVGEYKRLRPQFEQVAHRV